MCVTLYVGKPFGFWRSEKPVATGFAKGLLITM